MPAPDADEVVRAPIVTRIEQLRCHVLPGRPASMASDVAAVNQASGLRMMCSTVARTVPAGIGSVTAASSHARGSRQVKAKSKSDKPGISKGGKTIGLAAAEAFPIPGCCRGRPPSALKSILNSGIGER
ncbi:hypothetical protein ABT369_31655 [Dactylosporangium sp. NPDC000244]|uniref:hypothetical protein n=1 Tax=Dactylosporangium sp. NPDC000244 TaxID=3154365 RepID=UPI00331D7A39